MGGVSGERGLGQGEGITLESTLRPIPLESVDGWKKIPVYECGEKLVPVGPFSLFSDCDTSAVYFGERGGGTMINFLGRPVDRRVSLITHFVREGVLERLQFAQSSLPEGYYFKFFDNYRPLEVQQALFDAQKEKFRIAHPDWFEKELDKRTQTYVSLPSPNTARGTTHPSPHSTGGVVDLTIIRLSDAGQRLLRELNTKKAFGELAYEISDNEKGDFKEVICWIEAEAKRKRWSKIYHDTVMKNWLSEYRYFKEKAQIFHDYSTELDMGTGFDYFGPEAGTRYFEGLSLQRELTAREQLVLQNRRFLYRIMVQAGFANYPEEWWHYSYGDNMWAVIKNKPYAIYGGVSEMSVHNQTMEWARRGVYGDALSRVGQRKLFIPTLEIDPSRN